jgi:hypothetical protein
MTITIEPVLIRTEERVQKIWTYCRVNPYTDELSGYFVVWGVLGGTIYSRRLSGYHSTKGLQKNWRDKLSSRRYTETTNNSAAYAAVQQHVQKHLSWEQLCGRPTPYSQVWKVPAEQLPVAQIVENNEDIFG